jgi:hypothetical protein
MAGSARSNGVIKAGSEKLESAVLEELSESGLKTELDRRQVQPTQLRSIIFPRRRPAFSA